MSHGWSQSDRDVAKSALARAQKRANKEALQLFKNVSVRTIDDLWSLEMKIRDWKKERFGKFYFHYATVEKLLSQCIERGWLRVSDLQSMSEERLERIKRANAGEATPLASPAALDLPRRRPEWQGERGPRYGNNRKNMALTKSQERRIQRARDREDIRKLIKEDEA